MGKEIGNKVDKRKIIAIAMIIMQFMLLVMPVMQVFAEEGDAEESQTEITTEGNGENKFDGTDRDGNVFSDNNIKAHKAFKEASQYDPMMQYMLTYSILSSKSSTGPKESGYAKLSKGNLGEAFKGTGKDLKGKEVKNTNIDKMMQDLDKADTEEGQAAGDSSSNRDEESNIDKLVEQYEEAIAKDLAKELFAELQTYPLNLNITEGKIDNLSNFALVSKPQFDTEQDKGKWKGLWGTVGSLINGDQSTSGVGLVVPSKVKADYGKGTLEDEYLDALEEVLRKSIGNGGLGIDKYEGEAKLRAGVLQSIQTAEETYINRLANPEDKTEIIDVGKTKFYTLPETGMNQGVWVDTPKRDSWGEYLDEPVLGGDGDSKEIMELPDRFLIYVRGEDSKKGRERSESFAKEEGKLLVNSRYMWNLENLPLSEKAKGMTKQKMIKGLQDRHNEFVTKDKGGNIKKLREIRDRGDSELEGRAENSSITGWTPLHIKADWSKGYQEALKEQLGEVEPQTTMSSDGLLIDGGKRPLMVKDIFIKKGEFSPVLIGGKNNKYKDPYTSGVSLTVGKSEGNLVIGEDVLSNSIWQRTNKSGKVVDVHSKGLPEGMTDTQKLILGKTYLSNTGSASYESNFIGQDKTVGVDNYGNIISGDTGDVIIPYWANNLFENSGLNNSFFPYSPIITAEGDKIDSENELLETKYKAKGLATNAEIGLFIGKTSGDLYKDSTEVRAELNKGNVTLKQAQAHLESGMPGKSVEDTKRALAVVISASTSDAVKELNKEMLEDAEEGGEYYVSYDSMKYKSQGKDSEKDKMRWTAASFIQKAGWIMDYGMGDTIRLTIVSTMTRIYNDSIANSGLEFIFYTNNITNTEGWENVILLVATGAGFLITMYLLVMGFKAYRGEVRWMNVITKVFILSAIVLYPMYAYGNMVEYMINKPSTWILGNQMRLSVVLDTYFTENEAAREVNEFYENMFGKYADSESMQLGSYNLTFYTTTDKAGFDINTTDSDDSQLNIMERARLKEYQEGNLEYPTKNLVSVQVPLMDVYKWLWDVRYEGKGVDGGTEEYPTYEDVVKGGKVLPLFDWLAAGGSDFFVVSDYEPELATFREYRIVPNIVSPLELKEGANSDGSSTYGAAFQKYKGDRDTVNRMTSDEDIEDAIEASVLTASELMYEIVMNSSEETVNHNLGQLSKLSELVASPKELDANNYVPTGEDIRAMIRDLSNTREGREMWYGTDKNWSNFTKAVIELDEGTGGYFKDLDGKSRYLGNDAVSLKAPKDDFLGLTSIVDKYTPPKGDYNPYDRNKIEDQVSRINTNLLNNYMSTYAITKQSLGNSFENDLGLDHAEKMVMATEAYFQFNKSLGIRQFPTEYAVDSIKFDKYLALLFIPFNQYGQDTMVFFDGETVVPKTTAEYIAMSDNLLGYFLFAIAVIMLVVFGLTYLAILYIGLLVYSMYNFIKYYIIRDDYRNKSALGSMMIFLTLSMCKNALMVIVWAGSWFLNRSVAMSKWYLPFYNPTFVHSLALIAAVWFIMAKVIKPVFNGVRNDKENMGGQFFSDKASEVKAKITPNGLIPGGGSGVRGGSAASKFGDSSKSPDKGVMNNAKKLGSQGVNGLKKLGKGATYAGSGLYGGAKIAGKLGMGAFKGGKGLARMVSNVNQAAVGKYDDIRGIDGVDRKKVDVGKMTANNKVERKQLKALGKVMNGATHTVGGIAETALTAAAVGTQLAGFKNGVVTTMALGSAEAAAVVAQGLISKGITAKQDGNNVLFDSSGYDLEDVSVRGELFNNTVADLQTLTEGKKAKMVKRNVSSSDASNYNYVKGDGSIDLLFNKKSGFHEQTFSELMGTEEFSDLFITPENDDLIVNRKGHIEGIRKGALRLHEPSLGAEEVQVKMNQLYQREQMIREDRGVNLRENKGRTGFSVQGVDEEYFKNEIAPLVEGVKGMNVLGSRITHSKVSKNHAGVVNEIERKIEEYNGGIDEKFGDASGNIMQYVAKDGDDQGVIARTLTGKEAGGKAMQLYGTRDFKKDVSKYKVDKDKMHKIEDNVRVTKSLNRLAKSKSKEKVEEFVGIKEDMRNLLKTETEGMVGKDYETFGQEAFSFLDTTGVGHHKGYKTVQSNIQEIERMRKSGDIDEGTYFNLVKRENQNLIDIMDGTGKLDGFILNRYDQNNPYIKEYEKKMKDKAKDKGLEYKTMKDFYNESVSGLESEVGRKELMEMPLGVVKASVGAGTELEEFNVNREGVLTHKYKKGKFSNKGALSGNDKDAIRSYLLGEDMKVEDKRDIELKTK